MAEHGDAGAAIRQARIAAGLTLRGLAADIGVSAGTMSAIENGKVSLTVERLQAIADRLHLAPTELLTANAVPPPTRPAPPETGETGGDWRRFADLELDPALRAAVEVFTELGYHGATMRLVATAADSSIAGIYHYHRSKQQLLVSLMDLTMQDLEWRVTSADAEGGSAAQRFARMVEALALCHLVRRESAFISTTEMRSLEEPDRSRIVAARRRIQDRLDAAAVAAAVAGAFTTVDPVGTSRAIASMCTALPTRFTAEAPPAPEQIAREYAGHALAMMRPSRVQLN